MLHKQRFFTMYDILANTSLFAGLCESEIQQLLETTGAYQTSFTQNQVLVWEGQPVTHFGIVLVGNAYSAKASADGAVQIITAIAPGDYVGILLAASDNRKSPVRVVAKSDGQIVYIPFSSTLAMLQTPSKWHTKFVANFLSALANKAMILHDRIDCLVQPTVRAKVLNYLQQLSDVQQSEGITIPFDRQQMASYLNVERSALSRELSRMKQDGLIAYHKNRFHLLYTLK